MSKVDELNKKYEKALADAAKLKEEIAAYEAKKDEIEPLKLELATVVKKIYDIDPSALPGWLIAGFTDKKKAFTPFRLLRVKKPQ